MAEGSAPTRSADAGESSLEREIGTPLLALYGAGTILGAGIYVLIGKIAGHAGLWTPFAFLAAATIAAVNGLVYAELASRAPGAGGPAEYVSRAFDRKWLSAAVGWMIVATGVVSAATITTGFSGYVTHFVDLPEWLPRTALLVGIATVAALGAKESAWFMAVTTTLGIAGLGYVMVVGFAAPGDGGAAAGQGVIGGMPSLLDAGVATGVLSACFLAIYAFIGFEDMVHLSEEVKRPSRSMPRAIAVAVAVAAVLYVIVSFAALRLLDAEALARSEAPLVAAVTEAGQPGWPLAVLSLWIILNGALAQIVMASRVIYSLGDRGAAPAGLGRVSPRTNTPLRATLAAAGIALALALFLPLEMLASITSFIILLVFASANAALIALERREPEAPFDVPVALPWIGLVLSLGLIVGRLLVPTGGGH